MSIYRSFKPVYRVCDACVKEHSLILNDYQKRLADAPIGHTCDVCGECAPTDVPTEWPPHCETAARNALLFIHTHGFEAHITLTHMIRVLDGYTYRDDNGMLCNGEEWVHLDPTQGMAIYEFLGY